MANVNHNTLTDPYLHEPKGASTAATGDVYIANGAGSGTWKQLHNYVNGYIDFDAITPAYTHAVTTSFTPINPTFILSVADGWTGVATPNARLKYTGVVDVVGSVNFSVSFKNSSGASKDVEMIFYRNGVPLNGGHLIATAASGDWKALSLVDIGEFSTNDYLEVFVKGSAAFSLLIASASLTVLGMPV